MYITKTFKHKMYDCDVQLIVTSNILKVVNNLYKKFNTGMKYTDYIAGLMLSVSMNKYYIIINSEFLTYNIINHELFHAVMSITSDRTVYEEESRALLMGTLSEDIYTFLKTKNIKIN